MSKPVFRKKGFFQRFVDDSNVRLPDNKYIFFPMLLTAVAAVLFGVIGWWVTGSETIAVVSALIMSQFSLASAIFQIYRSTRRDLEDQQRKLQANFWLQQKLPLRRPLPYMTGWAATPELALELHERIVQGRPGRIVELGSGITTLICAYTLEQEGIDGQVISFDHDEPYARQTRRQLAEHGLTHLAEVRSAPLSRWDDGPEADTWYDRAPLKGLADVDLLIVDGPPVREGRLTRYPALPMLAGTLSERAVVVLHDTRREEETETVRRWLREFPGMRAETRWTEKGITVLWKKTDEA